jgi:hypothetical protein
MLRAEERHMRQKPYVAPIVTMFVGLGLIGSLARSPVFQTYRMFDIISLVMVGACFGYAAASIARLRRSLPERP